MKENTVVVYRGPSQINGSQIFMAVTGLVDNTNRKTGAMLQTYIMVEQESPISAVRSGRDVAICAGCKHRVDYAQYLFTNKMRRTCYVNIGQGPRAIYEHDFCKGYRLLSTPAELMTLGDGRLIRVGTYGDPVAVPISIWESLLHRATGYTGYTHQWKNPRYTDYKRFCQASVDNEEEARLAAGMGWGYFRVMASSGWALIHNEGLCPASNAAGKVMQCDVCLKCSGVDNQVHPNYIAIPAHGPLKNFVEG